MSPPIRHFVDEYLEYSKTQEDVERKTQETRERVLGELSKFFDENGKDIFLDNAAKTKFKLKEFFEWSELKPHGMNVAAITGFFRYLRDNKEYERDNARDCIHAALDLKINYDDEQPLQRVERARMSFDEKERLIRAAKSFEGTSLQMEIMLRLIMEAGLSRTELLALKTEHVNFESKANPVTIEVLEQRKQNVGDKKKEEIGSQPRYVAGSLETRVKIRELIEREDKEGRDGLIWDNASYGVPQRWLNKIVERAGIEKDIKIGNLRRNAIVELVEKEVEQYRISEYFGKESAVTSNIVAKYSYSNPSGSPLAENKRLF
ncbi:MAG: tyrosine-type recombinase/integrase [Candidatus Nanohaloarchaea archaeon]